jgi:hypothetical protein
LAATSSVPKLNIVTDWSQRVTAVGGFVIAIVAVLGFVYTTTTNHDQQDANRAQQRLTEQGQITDRFTRAIDQLGADKLDVRLGAIYSLARIMRDSADDEGTIVDVLAAFVREHTHSSSALALATDVQAVLMVLGRRPHPDRTVPDLSRTWLRYAGMSYGNYRQLWLLGADVRYALLTGSNLSKATLAGANLAGADLTGADLTGADLTGADLTGAHLSGANLAGAHLSGVKLTGADLTGAHL